jgi:hypothetical protein
VVTIMIGRRSKQGDPIQFALFTTATILVAYHEYAYDLVLLVIPILSVWDWSAQHSGDADRGLWVRLAAPVLILGSIAVSVRPPMYAYGIVVLFVLLCREVLRSGRVSASREVLQASA